MCTTYNIPSNKKGDNMNNNYNLIAIKQLLETCNTVKSVKKQKILFSGGVVYGN